MGQTTKPLMLELDVFGYILERLAGANQSASTFLREQLRIPAPMTEVEASDEADSDLTALLQSERFRYARGVVGKFLVLLSWLHARHPDQFGMVENIKGRGRLYFAKSPEPLHKTGRSVNPKQIPNSDYWVITTSPTDLKQEMLGKVMEVLRYSKWDIIQAKAAIRPPE